LLDLLSGEYKTFRTDVDHKGDENEQVVKVKPIL
jgi:hypothetical protein